MRVFMGYIKHEQGRFLTHKNLIIAFLFGFLTLYSIHNGFVQYNNLINSIDDFKKIENSKVKFHPSYTIYGIRGVRLAYFPPTQNVFFYTSGFFSGLYSHIDAELDATIYSTYNGRSLFEGKPESKADFSNLILIFGSLLFLFWGYDSFRNREYLKTLSRFTEHVRLYVYLSLARFLWMFLYFAILLALAVLLAIIEGVHFLAGNYLSMFYFFGIWTFIALILFLLGSVIGTIKSNVTGISVIIASWLMLIFVFPVILENITIKKTQHIRSNADSESEKWYHFKGVINRATKEIETYKNDSEKRAASIKLAESFMTNEYRKIQAVDRELGKQMLAKTREYQMLSILTPSTYYRSVTDELSGKGYNSVNQFFLYTQDMKNKFCEFFKQKKYYSKDKKVESFIKGDENIYYGKSSFPGTTGLGLIVLALYTLLLGTYSYRRFKKILFSMDREQEFLEANTSTTKSEEINEVPEISEFMTRNIKPLKLEPGDFSVLKCLANDFKDFIYNACSGNQTKAVQEYFLTNSSIYIGREEINKGSFSMDFIYVCHPDQIPVEIKAGDIFNLAAAALKTPEEEKREIVEKFGIEKIKNISYGKLKKVSQLEVLLAVSYLKKFPLVVFADSMRKMPVSGLIKLKKRMEEIASEGSIAILLTEDINVSNFENSDNDYSGKNRYHDITKTWK